MNYKKAIGDYGEKLAANYLAGKGYKILHKKYYSKYGEADLVAEDKEGQIVFVEVKTRLTDDYGQPEEAVDEYKFNKLYNTALGYFADKEINHDNFRIDLIAVEIDKQNKKANLRHYENVY